MFRKITSYNNLNSTLNVPYTNRCKQFMTEKIRNYILNASPLQWIEYAQELREASELIWKGSKKIKMHINFPKVQEKQGLSRVYFLNIGFSIENLLKGLLISENPDYLKSGKISPDISSGHNLENLASKIISIEFNAKEIKFLKLLSRSLPNWSRYPIPKRWEINNEEEFISSDLRKTFLELWDKIGFKIYKMTKDGWKGPEKVTIDNWRDSYFEGSLNFELPTKSNK